MATVSNLSVDQGTSFSTLITLTSQNGVSINLTGYTIQSQFRKSYQSSTYINFIATIVDAVTGQIQLRLDPDTTSNIKAGRYLYDVEITSPTNQKARALEGILTINPEITG